MVPIQLITECFVDFKELGTTKFMYVFSPVFPDTSGAESPADESPREVPDNGIQDDD